MFKNGVRPVHPGEVLREDYLVPLVLTANALAKALNVPAPRINDIVRERRGVTADTAIRFVDIGTSAPGMILAVAYAERRQKIRLISCRKATKAERKIYEERKDF